MNYDHLIAWLLVAAVAGLVLAYAWSAIGTALRRRARQARYRRALQDTPPPSLGLREPDRGISRARVAIISRDAEVAAWQAARGGHASTTNPHPARTREFILWEASFQNALSDFTSLDDELLHSRR